VLPDFGFLDTSPDRVQIQGLDVDGEALEFATGVLVFDELEEHAAAADHLHVHGLADALDGGFGVALEVLVHVEYVLDAGEGLVVVAVALAAVLLLQPLQETFALGVDLEWGEVGARLGSVESAEELRVLVALVVLEFLFSLSTVFVVLAEAHRCHPRFNGILGFNAYVAVEVLLRGKVFQAIQNDVVVGELVFVDVESEHLLLLLVIEQAVPLVGVVKVEVDFADVAGANVEVDVVEAN